MVLPITSAAAGYLVALCAGLSLTLALTRAGNGVHYGSGKEGDSLMYKVRAQGNCLEYTPLIIISLALAEANELAPSFLSIIAVALCVARTAHVWQLWNPKRPLPFRMGGFLTTVAGLFVLAALNLGGGLGYF